MSKFKIGDLVEVKQWDEMAEEFGINRLGEIRVPGIFAKKMAYLCGQRLKIEKIDDDGFIQNSKEGYSLSTDMLKKVDLHKNKFQCTGDFEAECILTDGNGNKTYLFPCNLTHHKSSESNVKKNNIKYEVIGGTFEGFVGEIVDSNKEWIWLGNEFGEKCYVKRSNLKRTRTNYVDASIKYKNEVIERIKIEGTQDKNITTVKIKDADSNDVYIGEACCMESDKFNEDKGYQIAVSRAMIKKLENQLREFKNKLKELCR